MQSVPAHKGRRGRAELLVAFPGKFRRDASSERVVTKTNWPGRVACAAAGHREAAPLAAHMRGHNEMSPAWALLAPAEKEMCNLTSARLRNSCQLVCRSPSYFRNGLLQPPCRSWRRRRRRREARALRRRVRAERRAAAMMRRRRIMCDPL